MGKIISDGARPSEAGMHSAMEGNKSIMSFKMSVPALLFPSHFMPASSASVSPSVGLPIMHQVKIEECDSNASNHISLAVNRCLQMAFYEGDELRVLIKGGCNGVMEESRRKPYFLSLTQPEAGRICRTHMFCELHTVNLLKARKDESGDMGSALL